MYRYVCMYVLKRRAPRSFYAYQSAYVCAIFTILAAARNAHQHNLMSTFNIVIPMIQLHTYVLNN